LPRLSVFHNDYGPHGFEAIAINLSEDMEAIVKVWARQNTNQYLRDNGSVWPVYTHNNAIPLNYVIDTAGVIAGVLSEPVSSVGGSGSSGPARSQRMYLLADGCTEPKAA
jgi:hypothetical protein